MISRYQTSIKQKIQRHKYYQSEILRRHYKLLKLNAKRTGIMPLLSLPGITIKNYCLMTGKARSVYAGKFGLSRHQVKAYFCYLTGLRNSSW